ncbi:hypothetical protein L1049_028005 [Liquidambar formosana]|uniref:Uncharacterized protein n=1 Tax=Liquidambar formosana TaxID=63359 RepID=A0AAP0WW98_LIQFO
MQMSPVLSLSPSFTTYSSRRLTDIAARVVEEFRAEAGPNDDYFYCYTDEFPPPQISNPKAAEEEVEEQRLIEDDNHRRQEDGDEDNDDFEFSFVCKDQNASPISADEIFSNGQIKPIFPLFNRDLLLGGDGDNGGVSKPQTARRLPLRKLMTEDRDSPSCSSSEADELEALPSETYCVWRPKAVEPSSPEVCKKSNSTGSSKRWKFRDLLYRSNSDGKDTFVFLTPSASTKSKKKVEKEVSAGEVKAPVKAKANGVAGSEGLAPSAHEAHYVRNRATKDGDRRRSYLPYRQDLVGFFSNVNGLSRNLHPF